MFFSCMSFGAHTSPFSFDKTNNHIHIPHNAQKTSKADTNHSVSAFFFYGMMLRFFVQITSRTNRNIDNTKQRLYSIKLYHH